jgi:hypothetical protein
MTRCFRQADLFSIQRERLARVLSSIKGTHSLRSDDFSTKFSSGFWCSSFLCYPNTRKVFRRLCLLLNASNWVLRARNACSFEGVFDSWLNLSQIAFFGPAVPPCYSRPGVGPSNCLFRASSAFKLFEAGVGPSNCLFRASSAFKLFEAGCRSLELSFSGQQCLQVIRGWASVPRVVLFGPAMLSRCSSLNYEPLNHPFRAGSATIPFGYGCLNPRNASLDR